MAHQVFVSYATEDLGTASRVCELLEVEGIPCWLAPRDVSAGADYASAIVDAIRTSELVVLVFSAFANASPYVLREIDRAVAYGRPVLALRLDDEAANSSFEYYVDHWQRLDTQDGVEHKDDELIAQVRGAIAGELSVASTQGVRRRGAGLRRWNRRGIWLVAALILLAAVVAGAVVLTRGARQAAPAAATVRNSWQELQPRGPLPPARAAMRMVSGPQTGEIIMFGGTVPGENRRTWSSLNDTWTYDSLANRWTKREPADPLPSARGSHAMDYDPQGRRVILFGGVDGKETRFRDTWAYDPAKNVWTELKPAGKLPPARADTHLVYDASSRRLLMFGGRAGSRTFLNDLWAYDPAANTWTELRPSGPIPPVRAVTGMALDPETRRLIVFGGWIAESTLGIVAMIDDTWAYDLARNQWTELEPTGAVPLNRVGSLMVYDPSTRKIILFGGGGANDTFAYYPAANTWSDISGEGGAPTATLDCSMVYDPATARMILFGGAAAGYSTVSNSTWAYTP